MHSVVTLLSVLRFADANNFSLHNVSVFDLPVYDSLDSMCGRAVGQVECEESGMPCEMNGEYTCVATADASAEDVCAKLTRGSCSVYTFCQVDGEGSCVAISGARRAERKISPVRRRMEITLLESGTPGNYYGTQYTEEDTPTIEHCAKMCFEDVNCKGITYGTQNGEDTKAGVSDGGRANDCIFLNDMGRSDDNNRWNTYIISDVTCDEGYSTDYSAPCRSACHCTSGVGCAKCCKVENAMCYHHDVRTSPTPNQAADLHPCATTPTHDGIGENSGCCEDNGNNCPAGIGDCNSDAGCAGAKYFILPYGEACDYTIHVIRDLESCHAAAKALRLNVSNTWTGDTYSIPRGCSYRASDGYLHFNKIMWTTGSPVPKWVGSGRDDLQPVCNLGGLYCVKDNGDQYGYTHENDTCVLKPHKCTANGQQEGAGEKSGCCTPDDPCGMGLGDCNKDADCQEGLVCVDDIGLAYGYFSWNNDICMVPPHPCTATGEDDGPGEADGCCTVDNPCPNGVGDCNTDDDCEGDNVCNAATGNSWGYVRNVDVCSGHHCRATGEPDAPGEAAHCCTEEHPCPENVGDCNTDADCKGDLVCAQNVGNDYGYLAPDVDVCLSPSLVADTPCPDGPIVSACSCGGEVRNAMEGKCAGGEFTVDTVIFYDSPDCTGDSHSMEYLKGGGDLCQEGFNDKPKSVKMSRDVGGLSLLYACDPTSEVLEDHPEVINAGECYNMAAEGVSYVDWDVDRLEVISQAFPLHDAIRNLKYINDFIHGKYWQARIDACKAISASEPGQRMKRLAMKSASSISVNAAVDCTVLFIEYEIGVALTWGEKGQFACSDNQSLGLTLGLLGIGTSTGFAISPVGSLGGWANVSAGWGDKIKCYSIGFGFIEDISLTWTVNEKNKTWELSDIMSLLEITFRAAANFVLNKFHLESDGKWKEIRNDLLHQMLSVVGKFGITDVGVAVGIGFDIIDLIEWEFPVDADATICTEKLVYCAGEGCSDKVMQSWWPDGTLCGIGTTCRNCLHEYTYWYGKAMTACGTEPKWEDGTPCLAGTTCNNCENQYSFWPGPFFTCCGTESLWPDGTMCVAGSTCNHCSNGYSFWNGSYDGCTFTWCCGKEPCWPGGTECFANTCNTCCFGHHQPWYQAGFGECCWDYECW